MIFTYSVLIPHTQRYAVRRRMFLVHFDQRERGKIEAVGSICLWMKWLQGILFTIMISNTFTFTWWSSILLKCDVHYHSYHYQYIIIILMNITNKAANITNKTRTPPLEVDSNDEKHPRTFTFTNIHFNIIQHSFPRPRFTATQGHVWTPLTPFQKIPSIKGDLLGHREPLSSFETAQ